jgi:hypothetical protein
METPFPLEIAEASRGLGPGNVEAAIIVSISQLAAKSDV